MLIKLNKQDLLEKWNLGELSFYEDCVFEKTIKVSFKIATHTTKQTLDYIHSDLWRPSKINSHSGARCFLSIIDDFSRKVCVYILKK